MRRGFSLVELIVVIGILSILMSVCVPAIGKARENARAAQCMANLRTLAQGCYNAAMEMNRYPFAGSAEYSYAKKINGKSETVLGEHRGWLSWYSQDFYANDPKEHRKMENPGWGAPFEQVEFALTNGAIWKALGGNRSCYVCPSVRKDRPNIGWTYAMNSRFHYDYSYGTETTSTSDSGVKLNSLDRADRTLMFAELEIPETGGGTGTEADGILEYDDGVSQHKERIGFNHTFGKRKCAHIAYADCHVERLEKLEKGNLYDLTKWLCEGYDISYKNDVYSRIEESQDDGE